MSPYITYRDKDNKGVLQYYILQREFPHYIGVISNYPVNDALVQVPIAGHNMYIVFVGTLRGAMIPSYKDVFDEMFAVFSDMALWYFKERILLNESRYKKFKIEKDVPSSGE